MTPFAAAQSADEPLEIANCQRRVGLGPVAFRFAGMIADPAANRRQWVALLDQRVSFGEPAGLDQADVAGNVQLDRAGVLAGRSKQAAAD